MAHEEVEGGEEVIDRTKHPEIKAPNEIEISNGPGGNQIQIMYNNQLRMTLEAPTTAKKRKIAERIILNAFQEYLIVMDVDLKTVQIKDIRK